MALPLHLPGPAADLVEVAGVTEDEHRALARDRGELEQLMHVQAPRDPEGRAELAVERQDARARVVEPPDGPGEPVVGRVLAPGRGFLCCAVGARLRLGLAEL